MKSSGVILATLLYIRRGGKTLMIHRVKKENDIHEGKWNGVGGKFEPGETPEACAVREAFEETGLRIRNPLLRGLLTFPGFARGEDWYVFVFVVTEFEGALIDSPEGNLEWIPDERILSLPLWEGDEVFIPWLDRPEFFSARFTYRDGRLESHHAVFHPPLPSPAVGGGPRGPRSS